ncbi:tyrosine-protein phosphatase non-receptor type 3 isoform X2 [Willisornis vidua]|uniref:Tyrosine-protein phosphatase non-receptor type 3 isoform X2 n=1 Tax=Willisornis vidua TaxID=1566151 RepID=A0ABQ9DRV3_9PASS|nr:tyrosine-protein phosphatase non-receptor type 3 isoform X2 [Willisornis vidua]
MVAVWLRVVIAVLLRFWSSFGSNKWSQKSPNPKIIYPQVQAGLPSTSSRTGSSIMGDLTLLSCPISSAVVLASYAVQSQLGDYNASMHQSGHLSNYNFIPEQNKDFLTKVESLHEQHRGLKQSEAESCYINIARTLEFYGVELHSGRDLHNLDLMIGIASSGIAVYRKLICTSFYPWSVNNQYCRKVIGGMVWNPSMRRSLSVEHLETKSLPSRSPPVTPNWRSPRLRHEIRKPRHSSVDNLTNEISYITETEDVFYTYKGSPTSKDSDSEFSQNCSPQRRSSEQESPKNVLGNSPTRSSLTRISPKALTQSPNGVGNISGSYPLEGVDKQFLETYDNVTKSSSTEDSSQYYCDKNDLIEGDLLLVRIIPDEDGKFGFNLKGGVDQKMPLVVSRITPGSPADKCIPKLNEGDQIILINGRDISEHTHDQVVMFIKASRESHTRELALLVRRKVVKQFVETKSEDEADSHNLPESILPVCSEYGGNTLEESMEQLRRGLESGTVLIQFEQLYRKKPGLTVTCAKVPQNMDKNRYKDVLPYDATRIILRGDEDYINANYVNMEIPSVGIVNRYIATQGPLPHTCAHFWQVVWDHKLSLIIMLTTLTERGRTKCHQYWPDPPDVMEYGSFRVRCHSEDCTIAYVVREMVITNVEDVTLTTMKLLLQLDVLNLHRTEQQHTVTHLQYVAWPDHGVPDDSMDFLEFVTCMRPKRVKNEPVLVHCSAGIGRTGVLVTMETAMCLIERNQPVYPLDIVRKMRDQRAMMVQTSSQYKFVCEAILRVYKEGLVRPLDSS